MHENSLSLLLKKLGLKFKKHENLSFLYVNWKYFYYTYHHLNVKLFLIKSFIHDIEHRPMVTLSTSGFFLAIFFFHMKERI